MNRPITYRVLTVAIAMVWLINGLFCKVLNLVPRHQQIVSRILDVADARILTLLIGCAEIAMALWVLSQLWTRTNTIFQIIIVLAMNIIEFICVPDLLLWGRLNLLFAMLFIWIIYYHEFILKTQLKPIIQE